MAKPPYRGGPPWGGQDAPPFYSPPPPVGSIPQPQSGLYVGNSNIAVAAASPAARLNCAKGNGIVVFCVYNSTEPTISDSVGNSYQRIPKIPSDGNAGQVSWYVPVSVGTNPLISLNGGSVVTIAAFEIVGGNQSGFFLDAASNTVGSASAAQFLRTSSPGDIILSCCAFNSVRNPPAGYSVLRRVVNNSGDVQQAFAWTTSPQPVNTVFGLWNGTGGSITVAIRAAGQPVSDFIPVLGIPTYPPGVRNPVVPFPGTPPASNPNVTVGLLGQSAVFIAGVLTPNIDTALIGSAANFTSGLLTATPTVPLVGQSATFSAGTLVPNIDVALLGQQAIFNTGTLGVSGDKTLALVGQAATFTSGLLSPSTSVAILGQQATFQAGTVSPSVAAALTGQGATFASGLLSPSTSVSLAGQQAIFTAGLLSVQGDKTVALTGAVAIFSAGTLLPPPTVSPFAPGGGRPHDTYRTKEDEDRLTKQTLVLKAWEQNLLSTKKKDKLMIQLKKKKPYE